MKKRDDSPMRVVLTGERKNEILRRLTDMYRADFDQDLSAFRAERILSFFLKHLGPLVYNQAIQDARGFMMERLEDLDASFHEEDEIGDALGESAVDPALDRG